MKLKKNQLRILRKVNKGEDNSAHAYVKKKLEKKGVIRNFIGKGSFITTPEGYKVLRKIDGQNNF